MRKNFLYYFYALSCLAGPVATAHRIDLIPITLDEGENYASSEVFSKNSEAAEQAGIDLSDELDKFIAQGYSDGNAFVLFYNFIQASGCERDYVIQTVKLAKKFYDQNGRVHHEKNEYLVEVMKLNQEKLTKKPDQHLKRYALGNAHQRGLLATYEVGCGNISGIADGNTWPFKPSKSYRRVQDYSEVPGLYDQVKFDFSRKYTLGINFGADGNITVQFPDFLAKKLSLPPNSLP